MTLSQKQIIEIIETAIHAPSGENSQPWRFVLKKDVLEVWNTPDADTSIYNHAQRGAYIAHGALLENITLIAKHFSHDSIIKLFPDRAKLQFIAQISFSNSSKKDELSEELYKYILRRSTNRKKYHQAHLPVVFQQELLGTQKGDGIMIHIIDDEQLKQRVSSAASINEKLLFEIPSMHNFFFSHIRWTKNEEKKNSRGFYIKTLELAPPQEAVMKLMRHQWIFDLMRKLGIGKIIAQENADRYCSASAFCVISTLKISPLSLIEAGQLLQRIWLTITKSGWSMQPMSGLLFLYHALQDNKDDVSFQFSKIQKEEITSAYRAIHKAFTLQENEKLLMLFRIGKSDVPSATASKATPNIHKIAI